MSAWSAVLPSLASHVERRIRCVLVTLTHVRGSAPQEIAAKMLVNSSGLVAGTVGGGKLEAFALRTATSTLHAPENTSHGQLCQTHVINLQRDLGMSCGGEVTLMFELIAPSPWSIAIFGAGHVAQAVIALLRTLDCSLAVFDTRKEWIDRIAVTPQVKPALVEDLPGQVASLPANTFAVVMTQGHTTDLPVLVELLKRSDLPYVGVLGSAVKASKLRRELLEASIDPTRVEKLHCPIGLNIGNNTPAEIAVSVVAELLKYRDSNESA